MSRQPIHILCFEGAYGHIEVCAGYGHLSRAEVECVQENRRLEQDPNSEGRYIGIGAKVRRADDWRPPPTRTGEPSGFLFVFYHRVYWNISAVDGEPEAARVFRELRWVHPPHILAWIRIKRAMPYFH